MITFKRSLPWLLAPALAMAALGATLTIHESPASAMQLAPEAAPFFNGSIGNTRIGHNSNGGPALADGDNFGAALAAADINGDGRRDLLIGAPGDDTGGAGRGAVYIGWRGITATITGTSKLASNVGGVPGLNNGEAYGSAVAAIGDLNGDGISELMVGAPLYTANLTNSGKVYLHFMRANGTASQTIHIENALNGGPFLSAGDRFGSSIAGIGDVNKDGIPDVLIGAPGHTITGTTDTGAVYVGFMRANGQISNTVRHTAGASITLASNSEFGSAVAGLGDLNADTVPDIAVSAPLSGPFGTTYVLGLRATGQLSTVVRLAAASTSIPSPERALANGDDMNDDGLSDLLIGTPDYTIGGDNKGGWSNQFLRANGSVLSGILVSKNTFGGPNLTGGDRYGSSLTALGDIDGNGVKDVAVGASGDSVAGANRGAVYLTRVGGLYDDFRIASTLDQPIVSSGDRITFTLRYSYTGLIDGIARIHHQLPPSMTNVSFVHDYIPGQVGAVCCLAPLYLQAAAPPNTPITIRAGGVVSPEMVGKSFVVTTTVLGHTAPESTTTMANNTVVRTFTVVDRAPVFESLRVQDALLTGVTGRYAVTLTAGTNNVYVWDMGDGTVYTQPVTSALNSVQFHAYATPGNYQTRVRVLNTGGNISWQFDTNIYDPISAVTINLPVTATVGQPVTMSGSFSGSNASNIDWQFGDGNTAYEDMTTTNTYALPGTYTVTLNIANALSSMEVERVIMIVPVTVHDPDPDPVPKPRVFLPALLR